MEGHSLQHVIVMLWPVFVLQQFFPPWKRQLNIFCVFKNWNFVKLIFSWKTTWLSFVRSQVRAINHLQAGFIISHNIKEFYNMELYPKAPIFFGLEKITKNTIIIVVFMTHIASNTSSLIGSVWRSEEGLAT